MQAKAYIFWNTTVICLFKFPFGVNQYKAHVGAYNTRQTCALATTDNEPQKNDTSLNMIKPHHRLPCNACLNVKQYNLHDEMKIVITLIYTLYHLYWSFYLYPKIFIS